MSPLHLHLLLNHIPVIGLGFAFVFLAAALLFNHSELKKLSLIVIVAVALMAIPTFLTGEPAEKTMKAFGASRAAIHAHEDAAKAAMIGIEALGVIALAGLVVFRRRTTPHWFATSCLILTLAVGGAMAYTANLGGVIRHTELTSPAPGGAISVDSHAGSPHRESHD